MNDKILQFIEEMKYFSKHYAGKNGEYAIFSLFTAGYCYHFALILQSLFPGGKIKVVFENINAKEIPTHIVYEYDNKYYDYRGLKEGLYKLVDFEELDENTKNCFKHISGLEKREEIVKQFDSEWL